jgi:hypothetical protein
MGSVVKKGSPRSIRNDQIKISGTKATFHSLGFERPMTVLKVGIDRVIARPSAKLRLWSLMRAGAPAGVYQGEKTRDDMLSPGVKDDAAICDGSNPIAGG